MSNLSNSELTAQIEKINRRLFGHGIRYDLPIEKQVEVPNSNKNRMFNLLMRKAQLENELHQRLSKDRKESGS